MMFLFSTEDADFQPQVLIMLGVVFATLFALAGKALLQKLLERKRLNKKSIFHLKRGRCKVKGVTPVLHVQTPTESITEPDVLPTVLSPIRGSAKSVAFETAATRGKQGSVKTIIIGNHESDII